MSNTWVCRTPEEDPAKLDTLYKLVTANPFFVFDFGNFDELDADGTELTGTPTVAVSPSGPTIGTPAVLDDYQVRVQVSGGSAGTTYTLTCTTVTAAGETLVGKGSLVVR